MTKSNRNGVVALTKREQEILRLIWDGFRSREIAPRLKISRKTVEAHRANMMKKLGCSNTPQLLLVSLQSGFIRVSRA